MEFQDLPRFLPRACRALHSLASMFMPKRACCWRQLVSIGRRCDQLPFTKIRSYGLSTLVKHGAVFTHDPWVNDTLVIHLWSISRSWVILSTLDCSSATQRVILTPMVDFRLAKLNSQENICGLWRISRQWTCKKVLAGAYPYFGSSLGMWRSGCG